MSGYVDPINEQTPTLQDDVNEDVAFTPYHPNRTETLERVVAFALFLNVVLVFLAMGSFTCFALESKHRGLTILDTGVIFSVHYILWFLSSPIWTRVSYHVDCRWMVLVGVLGIASCYLWMALVTFASTNISASSLRLQLIIVRCVQGLSSASASSGGFYIIVSFFPNSNRTIRDIWAVIGYAIGSLTSAYLYSTDGMRLPLMVVVFVLVVGTFVMAMCLPSLSADEGLNHGSLNSSIAHATVWSLLSDGRIVLNCLTVCYVLSVAALFEPNLAESLIGLHSNITSTMSGMFFLVIALGYLMTSPLALLASNSIQRQTLVMLGLLMVVAGFCIVTPQLFTLSQLSVVTVGLFTIGCGGAVAIGAALFDIVECAGGGNMAVVYSLAGTLSLGQIIGSLLGSYAVQTLGFTTTLSYWCVAGLGFCVLIILARGFGLLTWPVARAASPRNYRL